MPSFLPTLPVAKRDPLFRFLFLGALLYLGWYLLYAMVIHPWGVLDRALIASLIDLGGLFLRIIGQDLIPEPANAEGIRTIGVQGGSLLWIGDPCNGANLFAVFIIFLLAYPGPRRHKLWFGALGVLSIHVINALRIATLCLIARVDYDLLDFNHDYTFYVIVYGWVFLLWYIWVKRFGPRAMPVPAA